MPRLLLSLLLAFALDAADGITPTTLLVGEACALDGPAMGLGTGVSLGLKAAFAEANAAGGINGRKIRLIALDDGYDPERCADATTRLIEAEHVFCLAGYVGTPTCKAAIPIAIEKGVPVIGIFTGAMIFRDPPPRLVFSIRASYDDETEALVGHLNADLGARRIAILHQNDSFGTAGLSGTEKALARRDLALVGKGTFDRNTVAVRTALTAIAASRPDAVIMIGPYRPVAAFVREARSTGLSCPLATISFVGTEHLISELGAAAEGVVISQVMPSPADTSLPVVKDYRAALALSAPGSGPAYASLEGYVGGRVLLAGFAKAGFGLSRETLVTALESLQTTDLGGLTLRFGPGCRQAMTRVWLTRVENGTAVPIAGSR